MRISDWSSDVCSSDLTILDLNAAARAEPALEAIACDLAEALQQVMSQRAPVTIERRAAENGRESHHEVRLTALPGQEILVLIREIGRASCRERVCQYM